MAGDFLIDGIAVRDGFVSPQRVQELIDCAEERRARGEFNESRIGGDRLERREHIRGDSTCWLVAPLQAPEERLLRDFEVLRLELNRDAFLGLFDLELHYAWYPPGAAYARHVDQPQGRKHRQVSVILYLNPAWSAAAGGALRIFEASDRQRDIEPIAGRLVYFLSAGREHEVLPTKLGRLSVSGWFRLRDESALR